MSRSLSLWNLISTINMNSHHLRRSEIEYELKIRGIAIEGNADELRKKLTSCFSNNVQGDDKIIAQLDPFEEVETCEEKLPDLDKLVNDYEGNTEDNEYRRILARLWHWYWRVARIPMPATSETDLEDRHRELLGQLKDLIDSFTELKDSAKKLGDKLGDEPKTETKNLAETVEDVSQDGNGMELPPTQPPTQPTKDINRREDFTSRKDDSLQKSLRKPCNLSVTEAQSSATKQDYPSELHKVGDRPRSKMVPVYKWNLEYDGEGSQSVASFIERAEELSMARGVSFQELYESAVDLFSGTALIWYRSARRRIFSWEQLKEELKVVFQSADYDDRLQLEILHRTQGEAESLDLFLAAMDGLFGRLSVPLSEETKLQRILRNVNTFLQDKLCMFNITSLDDLRRLGRRAEVGRLRSSTHQPPPRPTGVLEPDLAWTSSRRKPTLGNIAYVNSGRDPLSSNRHHTRPLKCWNCKKENHTYRNCQEEKKIFCFGCGEAGVKKTACTRCKPKNL